jgi:hypothetical protein
MTSAYMLVSVEAGKNQDVITALRQGCRRHSGPRLLRPP